MQGSLVHRHHPTTLQMLPHFYTGDTRRTHHQYCSVFPHNGAMPAMSSNNAATDAARRLADALANPAPAAPFARFGAQTLDAIRQLAKIFAATSAPPNSTQPTRHTRTTVQLLRRKHSTNPQAPPRVPPAVPPSSQQIPPLDPPPRVEPPARDPPHRYPLRSRA